MSGYESPFRHARQRLAKHLVTPRWRYGGYQVGRIYVAWSRRDGLHVVGPRRHFHAFVWTRGHRRNPFYVSVRRYV